MDWVCSEMETENFLNARLLASWPKYSRTSLKDGKSSRDRFTRIVILTNFGRISQNLGDIFQSPGL